MNIMAVGWSVPSLLKCAGTFRSFKRDEHHVTIVVVEESYNASAGSGNCDVTIEGSDDDPTILDRDSSSAGGLTHGQIRAMFAMSDLPEPELVRHFDYSSVTQSNADLLADYRKRINPDLVIMPHWKSENVKDVILARSLLIACRGVGSVIMYGSNNGLDHIGFPPHISFRAPLDGRDQAFLHRDDATDPFSDRMAPRTVEDFESHRILLLEDAENDWL